MGKGGVRGTNQRRIYRNKKKGHWQTRNINLLLNYGNNDELHKRGEYGIFRW